MIEKIKNRAVGLLRQSQKYTQTDNVYLAKHGSYLMAGNIISLASAFILSIAFARLLPKETFGQYRYLLSVFAVLSIFSLEGMNNAIIQGVARGLDGVLKKGLQTKLKWSLLGSLASIGVGAYFWIQNNAAFALSFFIMAVFLPLFKGGETYQSYLTGKKLFGQKVSYTAIIQILATASVIITLFLTKNLLALILTYFAAYGILRMAALFWIIKKIKSNSASDPQNITYGKHLSLMGVIIIIADQIDKIMLFAFLGPVQLAIYSFASLPIEGLRAPLQNIQELALPKFSVQSVQEIKKTLPKKLLKSSVIILLAIIAYIMTAPYLYKIFYPQYLESVFYSRLFSFTLLVFPVSMMMISLLAKMKTRELYISSALSSIIRICLLVVLIPFYGILGIIIATLLSQILYFFIVWFLFKKM